jgi:hypothetical protein
MSLLRLINVQGVAGLIVGVSLAILLLTQKAETAHWKKQSGHFEQLYGDEQAALAGTVANYRAAAERRGRSTAPTRPVSAPSRPPSTKGHRMTIKRALPPLALLLSACAAKPQPPQPIAALAEERQCPAYPLPPADLLKPPAKTDFLSPTPSPPPSRRSSSMR